MKTHNPNILVYFCHSLLVFLGEYSSPERISSGPPWQKVISFFVFHSIICTFVWGPPQGRCCLVYLVKFCICLGQQQSTVASHMAIYH